ncbi:MAG: hypothetical protein U0Z44_00910 [Kouleothrix sp.]
MLKIGAEGRIVLVDTLFYAQRLQPDAMITLATLAGLKARGRGMHAPCVIGTAWVDPYMPICCAIPPASGCGSSSTRHRSGCRCASRLPLYSHILAKPARIAARSRGGAATCRTID